MTTTTPESDTTQTLTDLVERAKSTRFSPEQETEAVGLLKASLLEGKAAITKTVDAMINLPWVIGITAIVESWPELKPAARKNLLADLYTTQTEQERRFRLSLGRGMFSLEPPVALELVAAVCAEMTASETGLPSPKESQILFNVLIGKGKPWLLRLPLAEFKPEEAAALVRCAIAACFPAHCPPLTQLSLIRWIAPEGRLSTLPENQLESITKAVTRWHPKLQAQLKADNLELPPPLQQALEAAPAPQPRNASPRENTRAERPPERKRQPEYPARPSQTPQTGFDLVAALRQIETYVHSLHSELQQANARPAHSPEPQREPAGRDRDRGRGRPEPRKSESAEVESLQRHNQQLEETILELRERLEDLAADHEDIATSIGAHSDGPTAGEKEQFQALLAIKLRPNHAEFEKLAEEPQKEGYREPYRLLLEDVFHILEKHGVSLKEP